MADKGSRYADISESTMHIHQLRVARAHIRGGVQVRSMPEHPTLPTLQAGDAVELMVDYDFEEVDSGRDEYRFRLQATVDGDELDPVDAIWADTTQFPERARGLLQQRVVFDAPGEHTIDVDVEADHDVDRWTDGTPVDHDGKRVRLRIPVRVEE